jgi:hypothetical protein
MTSWPADCSARSRCCRGGWPRQPRLRVINTDNGPMDVWSSGSYRLLVVDGHDINQPTLVDGLSHVVTAGGRADLQVVLPTDGSAVRVQLAKATAVVLGAAGADLALPPQPPHELDLLNYGTPAPVGFDTNKANRHFE